MPKTKPVPRTSGDAELVRAAISATGLSDRQFAAEFGVNERTVRRWLAGNSAVRDRNQRERLEEIAACPNPRPPVS